jgi:hypothetical protein
MVEEAKKTRGKTRPAQERLAELTRKAARIEHSANEKARKEEWRTNGLAGVAAIKHATAHPEFARLLAAALRDTTSGTWPTCSSGWTCYRPPPRNRMRGNASGSAGSDL